jgi:type I restriction enzyme S subunit
MTEKKTNKQPKTDVPNLRFPEFEGDWEADILGEVCKMQAGKFVSASEILEKAQDESFPCYGGNGLRGYTKSYNQNGLYSLIGRQGALCGNITLADGKFYATEHAVVVTPDESIDTLWMYYLLTHLNLNQYATGAAQPGLSVQNLERVEVAIPKSKTEQQKISAILSLIDRRIQTQNKIIKQFESLIIWLSRQLFSQALRFKTVNGEEYFDWQIKKVSEFLTIGSGKDYRHLGEGDVPVFGTGGLMTYVDAFLYDGETVCIGRKGTIDKPMYYKGKIWTVDTLFYSHSFLEVVPKFIFYVFKMINWKEYNEASGVPSLSKSTIEKIQIEIPSLAEQRKIEACLSGIDDKIAIEKTLLEKYIMQKKQLLQNLFI